MAQPVEHRVSGKTAGDVFEPRLASIARAACAGDAARVRAEINAGGDPNGRGFEGVTPLLWAVNCENVAGVEALLLAGADPNMRVVAPRGSFTAVFVAIRNPNPAILRVLLDHGGDPNTTFEESPWTALREAYGWGLETGDWSNYYALLGAGADINRVYAGQTIAEFAASLNGWRQVAELLDRGYNHNLLLIGRFASTADPAIMDDEQELWLAWCRTMLEQRGVRFPVEVSDLQRER